MLSGIILTYAHLRDYPAAQLPTVAYYGRFVLNRTARVYPAYLVGLLIGVLVSILVHNLPDKFPLVLALGVTMLQSYFPSMAMDWCDGGAWSVSTEFFST